MVRTILTQVNWGVDALPDGSVQFTFADPDTKQIFHIPFDQKSLAEMLTRVAQCATAEVKEQVRQNFVGNGIVLPPRDFDPSKIQHGPQG